MLYIFDRDGTLTVTKSGYSSPITLGDQELLPNVSKTLRDLYVGGNKIAICSNQGIVSDLIITEYQAWKIMIETIQMIKEKFFTDIAMSFFGAGFFSHKYIDNAKPKPDMIYNLLVNCDSIPVDTTFVGNSYIDKEAANRAKVKFIWAHDFFGWDKNYIVETKHGYSPKYWERKRLEYE